MCLRRQASFSTTRREGIGSVHSASFRVISAIISTLLLAALISVIVLAVRDNPTSALPRLTPVPAGTGVAAAITPAPTDATTPAPTDVATAISAVTPTPVVELTGTLTVAVTTGDVTPPVTPPVTPQVAAADTPAPGPTVTPQPTGAASPTAADTAATPTPRPAIPTPARTPTVRVYSNGNFVNAVAIMRSTVWAATGGGVVAWNKGSGGFVKFTTQDGLAANHTVTAAVWPLPGLGVLFGGDQGIQIFDTQNGRWKTLDSGNSEMSYDDVAALWCDAEARLLVVGYERHGLDIFRAGDGSWTYVGEDAGLSITGLRDLAVARDGEIIWLATQNGLALYRDGEVNLFTTANAPLADNRIESIAADGSGAVWLTSGNTLYRTDGEAWDAFNAEGADGANFPNGRLTGLDLSSEGAIWLGSDQGQVCRFDPGIEGCVEFYRGEEGMATAPLTSLTVSAEGEVYFTTAGGGLSGFDGAAWRTFLVGDEAVPGNTIRDLVQGDDGHIWVAAVGGAARLSREDAADVVVYTPANSPLPAVDVQVVQPNHNGGLWLGAEGASFYDGSTWTNFTTEDGLAGSAVRAIAADDQNRIWIGTATGLSIWTGSTFFNLTTANGLPSDDISALQADGQVIWIGTHGGGLLRFQENQLQLFNRANSALPSDTITALALDADGQLLIGSDQGLARFVTDNLTVDAGLDGSAIYALAASPTGEVWAATPDGLQRFDGVEWASYATPQVQPTEITALLVDDAGDLWIGAARGGLVRYTP